MPLPVIYARREPTNDRMNMDVQYYADKECRQPLARLAWYSENADYDEKTTILNCNRYAVEWLEPVPKHLWPFYVMPHRSNRRFVAVLKNASLKGFYCASYDEKGGRTVLATGGGEAVTAWYAAENKGSRKCVVHESRKIDSDAQQFDIVAA
ncbi:unnamed protein product [Sphagnum jensenii]|uniref:Uncharacterized protein n=1 Tax=Sphagnum jensenii TaxID=128206 RepID=A0ABP0VCP0_9BRYO